MKKTFIIFGLIGAVLVTLVALATVLAPIYLNPNDYKDEIADLVHKHTGRTLTFNGDIGLSVFPWLGVELGPVALSNAQGFGEAPFAEAAHTSIQVKLLPLLSKDVHVKHVNVDGLSLHLARDAKGATNWADLQAKKTAPAAEPTSPAPQTDAGGPALPVSSLAVGSVSLSNARIAWDDATTGDSYRLSSLQFSTGPLAPGRPFDFTFATTAAANKPALSGDVRLAAQAEVSPDFTRHTLKNASLNLAVAGEDIPGEEIEAAVSADIMIDLNKGNISIEQLALKAAGLDVTGNVDIKHFDATPQVDTDLSFKQFNPRQVLRTLDLTEPETADPTTLQSAKLDITASVTPTSVNVPKLDLVLDDTSLSGSARVRDFDTPDVAFNLVADALDVNRYLPPAQEEDGDGKASTGGKNATSAEGDGAGIDKAFLRSLKVDGSLKVGTLKVHKLRFNDVQVKVQALDGLIRINPFSAGAFGGRLQTAFTTDMRTDTTTSSLKANVDGLNLGSVLTEFAGKDYVTGTTTASLDVSGTGENWATLSRTLDGVAAVTLRDGVFKGFQIIPEPVRAAAAQHDPQNRTKKNIEKQQPFQSLSASLKVRDGLVSTNDTVLTAPHLKGVGNGTLDLSRNWVDYNTAISISALPSVPFSISGPVTDPSFSLNKTAFLKNLVTSPLDVGKKALDIGGDVGKGTIDIGKDVLQGIGKGIGKGLDSIFGGKKRIEE